MVYVLLNNKPIITVNDGVTLKEIHSNINGCLNLDIPDYYLLQNGKIINADTAISCGNIEIVLRTYGGKGGFGSMLRAIGAQIEKTTNREACRDLSGRRLRDINEEKRLKKWITQQTEREKEAAERKQKKLERLCEAPKFEFKDKDYDNERTQLPELVESAVSQGMKATCSSNSLKRKNENSTATGKKKPKLWIDADIEDLSTSDSGESDDETTPLSTAENSESNSMDEIKVQPLSQKTEKENLHKLNEENDHNKEEVINKNEDDKKISNTDNNENQVRCNKNEIELMDKANDNGNIKDKENEEYQTQQQNIV